MGNRVTTNGDIQARIMKGWKPNRYLTNMSQAYLQIWRLGSDQNLSDLPGAAYDQFLLHIPEGRSGKR